MNRTIKEGAVSATTSHQRTQAPFAVFINVYNHGQPVTVPKSLTRLEVIQLGRFAQHGIA